MKRLELDGFEFEGCKVVERSAFEDSSRHTRWKCLCKCGNFFTARGTDIKSGAVASCGCKVVHRGQQRFTKHGKYCEVEYRTWQRMFIRCNVVSFKDYKDYGGRGIKVCDRWQSYDAFLSDMGRRPDGHSLDRIDVNGNYEPGNCRWATDKQQARNRRTSLFFDFDGQKRNLAEIAEISGVRYKRLHLLVRKKNMNPQDAVNYLKK